MAKQFQNHCGETFAIIVVIFMNCGGFIIVVIIINWCRNHISPANYA